MHARFLAFAALLLLGACLSLERQSGEGFLMDLPSVPAAPRENPAHGMLTVYLPTAEATLDTRRVAIIRPDGASDYYAGARWADFLPLVVRDSLVQSLSHRRLVQTVAGDEERAAGPYRLHVAIEDFQAQYERLGQAPIIRIHLRATLEDARRPSQAKQYDVMARQQAVSDALPAIQTAFRSAFETAQRDLMAQLSSAVK